MALAGGAGLSPWGCLVGDAVLELPSPLERKILSTWNDVLELFRAGQAGIAHGACLAFYDEIKSALR